MSAVTIAFLENNTFLKRFLMRFLYKQQDIEDVAQEAYLRAYIAEQRNEIDQPKAFLFRIARNVALTKLSRKSRQITDYLEETGTPGVTEFEAGTDEELEAEESLGLYCEAVAALPEKCRQVWPPGHPGSPANTSKYRGVSSDGNRVAWLEAKVEAVYPRLQVWAKSGDLDTVQCEFKECVGRIERLWWRDNREVVFLRREGADFGRQVIYGWDTVTDNVRRIYADTTRHLSACSSSGDLLVCFSDEPDRPRTIVSVEFIDGSVKEMFDPNPPFDRILVGAAERLEWRNSYGVESWGWVVKPVGYEEGKRYPLVIVQYLGYACFEGGTGAEYPAHLFAAAGFAVLCFDEPGMWDVYETMTLMEAQEIAWEDYYDKRVILASLEAAIEMLDGRGLIDPARVGITGLSSGSDTISFALSHTDRFSAAISSSGGWNPNSYYLSAGWVRTFNSKRGFGRPGSANDKYWSGMSLAANAERVNTPLLVLASDNEALYQMFQYVTLQELGKPIDMYVFPDEYHIKWHPQNRKSVAVRAVDWMRFWLRDEEDSHPAKAEQYRRWRKMRETTDAPAIAGGRK